MSVTKSPTKKADLLKPFYDTGVLDLEPEPRFPQTKKELEAQLAKPPIQHSIEEIIRRHLAIDQFFVQNYKDLFQDTKKRKALIESLRMVDEALPKIEPFLRNDPRIPRLRVTERRGSSKRTLLCSAVVYLSQGQHRFIADWLETHHVTNRRREAPMNACALELTELFEKETGRPNHKLVGTLLYRAFGKKDSAPEEWSKRVVFRERERRSSKQPPQHPPRKSPGRPA